MNFNATTINGLPVFDPPGGSSEPVNFFEMHCGASSYGWGKFLMRQSDYTTLASPSSQVTLIMNGSPGTGLTMPVMVAGFTPYSTTITQTGSALKLSTNFVSVIVFDRRCNDIGATNKQFNQQVSTFALNGDTTPQLYTSSLNSGTPWTWTDLFGSGQFNVEHALANLPTTWAPRNIVIDGLPRSKAVDIVADKIIQIVGYDGSLLHLYDIGKQSSANTKLLKTMDSTAFILGGMGMRNAKTRLPNKVGVIFRAIYPGSNPSDIGDANIQQGYEVDISTSFNGSYTRPLPASDFFAVMSSGTPLNATELNTVASDLTARWTKKLSQNQSEKKYAGIWPVFPDGQVWGVRWSSQPADQNGQGGATTTIRSFDDSPFSGGDGDRLADIASPGLGLGGMSVGNNYGGPVNFVGGMGGAGDTIFVTLANPTGSLGVKGVSAPTIVYDCYVPGNSTAVALAVAVRSTRGLFRVIPAQTGLLKYNWDGTYGSTSTTTGGPYLLVYEPPVTC